MAASSSRAPANQVPGFHSEESGVLKKVVKEQFNNYQVHGVTFDALNADEIARYSEVEVMNYHMYDQATRAPQVFGPIDARMGPTGSKDGVCATCQLGFDDCIGHFGHIKLVLPVYHVGFLKHVRNVIASICKNCGRVLVSDEVRKGRVARLRRSTPDDKKRIHAKLVDMCKKVTKCPHCESYNSKLKAMAGVGLMLRHEVGFAKHVPQSHQASFKCGFQDATESNRDIAGYLEKAAETMTPLTAYNLLRNLSAQDRELLDVVDPQRLLLTCIPVPPVCLRPTVKMGDSAMIEDDLTFLVGEIVKLNQSLREKMDTGARVEEILSVWQMLQDQVAYWINSEATGLLPLKKPIRSIVSRLKGKEGRFRGNLSGKRVDFSGRTVISPDPNVSVEQVVIPDWVARRMTFPERVCDANVERLRASIVRGNDEHPGAYCIRTAGSRPRHLRLPKNFRRKLAAELKIGSIVERHMIDGDIVLFNRQPSLHRLSIMAHRAKVMKGRTFRFNECVCAPYNADFDGDEMNIHLPQTDEARSEAIHLMGVRHGLVTPKSGEVVVHATQDFLTASFMLSQKDTYLSRDKFCQLCCYITDGTEPIDLPPPAILKPVELWTGKQAFSVLLRPNKNSKVLVNLDIPEKNYSKSGESMCPNDGWVIFRNSELLCGNLGKKALGGAKNGLFFRLIRDNSSDAAVACMSRIAKVSSRWLMNRGMTIGVDDVTAGPTMEEEKEKIVALNYANVDEAIKQFNAGTLKKKPGCDETQTLESMVNGQLGDIRQKIGDACETKLPRMNKPRIMATCGSKGSAINLCQMMSCVGQQNVGGERIKPGFVNRTLPHFLKFDKKPEARGFVANSFYSGLKPSEFFFHTMGGREGLVDTAVKTAETGYMQRRLIKALEDLSLKYDLTVRTSVGEVVQFAFGDDGLNPLKMEGSNSKPLDFDYVMKHVQHTLRTPRALVSAEREGNTVSAVRPRWQPPVGGPQAKRRRITSQPQEGALPLPPMPTSKEATDCVLRSREQTCTAEYRERPLLPLEMTRLAEGYADRFHDWVKRTHGSAVIDLTAAKKELAQYIIKLAGDVAKKRKDFLDLEPGDTAESMAKARAEAKPGENLMVENLGLCPTQMQLEAFVNRCSNKYVQGQLIPGEAVGAVAAQSIGEPATQMTLKTFHFAGVASMNVTLGVPRIREIINAAKTISTPIITCKLVNQVDEFSARVVAGRIERTMLGDICKYFKESYEPGVGCYISVKLDIIAIESLGLELTVEQVRDSLMSDRKVGGIQIFKNTKDRLKVEIRKNDKFRVFAAVQSGKDAKADPMMIFQLQTLKAALPKAVVVGLKSTTRAVVNKVDKDDKGNKLDETLHELLVEGHGLREIMNIPGIMGTHTASNHVLEVEQVLGIEAARRTIMNETKAVLKEHAVDIRHIQMLGDCMTYRGSVLGITRFGIAKMNKTALMLASFERPTDHIFDAAAYGRSDPIKGVSECIILGSTVNLGTGLFRVHYDAKEAAKVAARERRAPPAGGRFAAPGAASPGGSSPGGASPGGAPPVVGNPTVPAQAPPVMSEWRRMRREAS